MSCALSQKIDPKFPFFHRFLIAFEVTDEVFGISIGVKDKLNPYYTYGAMTMAIPGWALGTCLGVIFGNILPVTVVSALSVALYGMFIAIIIPPAKKEKSVAMAVLVSMVVSYASSVIPIVKDWSSGSRIILLTVVISLLFAIICPIEEDEKFTKEGAANES